MGYTGKLAEKLRARELRRNGLSYNEIKKILHVSKSTLSLWCRDITLSEEFENRLLQRKLKGALKGSIINAKKQQRKRIEETEKIHRIAEREIGGINRRDFLIAGAMLFAAEGEKADGSICFTNSDPEMIVFMMEWLRKICMIPQEKFRGRIYIHDNLNEKDAKNYWSSLTKISTEYFDKSYIAKNRNNKIRKNIHKNGVFAIRLFDRKIHRKIRGWIKSILQNPLFDKEIPGSSMVERSAVVSSAQQ